MMSSTPYFVRNPVLDDPGAFPQLPRVLTDVAPPPSPAAAAPPSPHLAHVLNTADQMSGPVAPAPPPSPTQTAGPGGLPRVTLDQNPAHQMEGHLENKLQEDYRKDTDPYGSADNHPGFFGKLAHALSHATGGDTRRQWEEQGLAKTLNTQLADEATNAYTGAKTDETKETTAEAPAKAASEEGLQGAQTDEAKARTQGMQDTAAQGPSLAAGYAHAVNQAIKEGRDPAQDPIVQHLSDAITSLQKPTATPPGTKTVQLEVGGKPHQVLVDERTGETVRDLGVSGEKPPQIRVETPGEERGAKNDVLKAYTPTLESAERMNVMTDAYEKAIKNHDQQAMLNLLANHLGMTMGLQKGARMTKDIINEAKNSQPWLAGMESKFDKDGYLSGVTLSPPQMRQMVNLGQERYAEDAKKSRATAQYLGAKDDGPQRVPGDATIRYYKGLAGGNGAQAKQLAAADGWSVQ